MTTCLIYRTRDLLVTRDRQAYMYLSSLNSETPASRVIKETKERKEAQVETETKYVQVLFHK